MSKRLEEIRNEYAFSNQYPNWDEFISDLPIHQREDHYDATAIQYAREVAIASLEKADKAFKNTAVKSIGTALKYFEERNHETIYKRDIISFLHAFYQFESQGLSIVGIGYKRYDGKEITDLEGAYEGGYFTEKKRYEITNPDNITLI